MCALAYASLRSLDASMVCGISIEVRACVRRCDECRAAHGIWFLSGYLVDIYRMIYSIEPAVAGYSDEECGDRGK